MWIVGFSILVGILYLVLISIFYFGWNRIPIFISTDNDNLNTMVSVIVPCRNEEDNISQLIQSLSKQTYPNFEVIIVNDHSEDATRTYIETTQSELSKFHLIDALGFGKKNALREGILKSTGDLIVSTDADCFHPNNWLQTIVSFQKNHSCDLVICPVKIQSNNSLFSKLQELEFTSLVASGAGASGAGMPILCNGANLVFTKKVWLKSQANLHEEEQSGDDMFLLENVKKQGGKIRFLKSESAFANTKGSDSLMEFITQRRRWTSKSAAYSDWQIIFTAIIVLLVNLLSIILLSLSFFNLNYLILFFTLFVFRYLLDSIFLSSVGPFFKLKNIWIYSLILSVIYPFYIVFVVLSSFIVKPGTWR